VSEESDNALDPAELDAAAIVAAELVARVEALCVSAIDLPIIDDRLEVLLCQKYVAHFGMCMAKT